MAEKHELSASPAPGLPAVAQEAALAIKAESELNWFMQEEKFKHLWRVSKLFASSSIVPDRFQSKYEQRGEEIVCVDDKTADCAIVIAMAWRHRADPMAFLNGVYVVHGRPGMEAKLAIALVNRAGVFSGPIMYELTGEGSSRECRAYTTLAANGEEVDMTVTMKMAEREGWTKKSGSKWLTIPDVMLRYRSAMFLIRLYAPETLFGMMSKDELDDMNARPVQVTVTADAVREKIADAHLRLPPGRAAAAVAAGAPVIDTEPGEAEDAETPDEGAAPAPTLELAGEVVDRETGEILTCKACSGSGKSSKGKACVACDGTGQKKPTDPDDESADPITGDPVKEETSKPKPSAKPKAPKTQAKPEGTGTSDKQLREERARTVALYIDVCEAKNADMGNVSKMMTSTIVTKIAELTGKSVEAITKQIEGGK